MRWGPLIAGFAGLIFVIGAAGGCGGDGADPSDTGTDDAIAGGAARVSTDAPVDQLFRYGPGGTLPITADTELPFDPSAVTARWATFRGWYAVIFEGLDLSTAPPLCMVSSVFDRQAFAVEHSASAPTEDGACEDGGAGQVPPAREQFGVRACGEGIALITTVPADISGTLHVSITRFDGTGEAVGISGRLEVVAGTLPGLDAAVVDCGPLPPEHVLRPPTPEPDPTPTVAPDSEGRVAAADREPPPPPTDPGSCTPPEEGVLQDVIHGSASPYLVHHPADPGPDTPTIVFLPGGSGRYGSAQRIWETVFRDGAGFEVFRVVIPYSFDADFIDEAGRTVTVVNEVLWCYGGDPARVHLAGASNGGLAAFAVMSAHPERFATLLGAPGAFPVQDPLAVDPLAWAEMLAGRAVFNGVGSHDVDWGPEVRATHNALAAAGIETRYVEFPSQGHVLATTLDPTPMLEFWASH